MYHVYNIYIFFWIAGVNIQKNCGISCRFFPKKILPAKNPEILPADLLELPKAPQPAQPAQPAAESAPVEDVAGGSEGAAWWFGETIIP